MFGYIRISKPEMRMKEYEMYKAVYCSLCKELGRSYGIFARMTLSYDFTFLALLNMSLKDGFCGTKLKKCTCNPFKKCTYLCDNDELKLPSAAAMIMIYYKVLDNIEDEKGVKRLAFKLAKPFFKKAHKKAAKEYPQLETIVGEYIKKQKTLEAENCGSIDKAANPTATALSQIFSLLSSDTNEQRVLNRMGYCIGRYIYILDAACDLEEDRKLNRYNPLKDISEENINENFIYPQLYICAKETASAMELLDIKKFKNILDNIIYLGLEDTLKKELKL